MRQIHFSKKRTGDKRKLERGDNTVYKIKTGNKQNADQEQNKIKWKLMLVREKDAHASTVIDGFI